jgi:hypothetical protein
MNDFDFGEDDDARDFNEDWNDKGDTLAARGTDNLTVLDIMDDLGIYHIDEFIVDFSNVAPDDLRGGRFLSIEETILHLYSIGVLSFSGVVRYGQDEYGEAIPPDSGKNQSWWKR